MVNKQKQNAEARPPKNSGSNFFGGMTSAFCFIMSGCPVARRGRHHPKMVYYFYTTARASIELIAIYSYLGI